MRQQVVKKIRQIVRRKERKKLENELKIVPQLFNPRPIFMPKFLWKLLFYLIVKKEMLTWKE
jgi:hypothetical protein